VSARVLVRPVEADFLSLARHLISGASYAQMEHLLTNQREAPEALTPDARRMLEETLATGAILMLARSGGWRQDGGQRLWERVPPPAIAFGPATLELLTTLLTTRLAEARPNGWDRLAPFSPVQTGDSLLLARLLLAVLDTPCEAAVATLPAVQHSALCWWLAPGTLAAHGGPPPAVPALDLTGGTFSRFVVEALQPLAAKTWVTLERRKPKESSTEAMVNAGLGQEASLQAFLEACEKAHARTLSTCLIEAACELVARGPLGGAGLARQGAPAPAPQGPPGRRWPAARRAPAAHVGQRAPHGALHRRGLPGGAAAGACLGSAGRCGLSRRRGGLGAAVCCTLSACYVDGMETLGTFLSKLSDYATNNITALEGQIQFTLNEREDLKKRFAALSNDEKPQARAAATAKGLDTTGWE
jgi:FtsH ternary system domain X6